MQTDNSVIIAAHASIEVQIADTLVKEAHIHWLAWGLGVERLWFIALLPAAVLLRGSSCAASSSRPAGTSLLSKQQYEPACS